MIVNRTIANDFKRSFSHTHAHLRGRIIQQQRKIIPKDEIEVIKNLEKNEFIRTHKIRLSLIFCESCRKEKS